MEAQSTLCPGSGEYGNRVDYEAAMCPRCGHAVRIIEQDKSSGTLGARVRQHLALASDVKPR